MVDSSVARGLANQHYRQHANRDLDYSVAEIFTPLGERLMANKRPTEQAIQTASRKVEKLVDTHDTLFGFTSAREGRDTLTTYHDIFVAEDSRQYTVKSYRLRLGRRRLQHRYRNFPVNVSRHAVERYFQRHDEPIKMYGRDFEPLVMLSLLMGLNVAAHRFAGTGDSDAIAVPFGNGLLLGLVKNGFLDIEGADFEVNKTGHYETTPYHLGRTPVAVFPTFVGPKELSHNQALLRDALVQMVEDNRGLLQEVTANCLFEHCQSENTGTYTEAMRYIINGVFRSQLWAETVYRNLEMEK